LERTRVSRSASVSNPSSSSKGAAIEDFMNRTASSSALIPGDHRAIDIMRELYAPFTRTGAPILMMDTASAELCKYAANAILAARISFMNEIANVCELVGADVDQVRKAIGSDRRIGPSFLFPGVGYGGSCFPKDVKALLRSAEDKGYDFRILARRREGQRLAEAAARAEDGAALQEPARAHHRAVGVVVQAAHRRHARRAGDSDHQRAARARCHGPRVRSGGGSGGVTAVQREDRACARKATMRSSAPTRSPS
jgi:nucleotide sugar dehydrogenase